MKVRIKVRPTGYVSIDGGQLQVWPKAGTVVDLPESVASQLIANGHAEKAPIAKAQPITETRPASKSDVETREEASKPGRPAKRAGDGG